MKFFKISLLLSFFAIIQTTTPDQNLMVTKAPVKLFAPIVDQKMVKIIPYSATNLVAQAYPTHKKLTQVLGELANQTVTAKDVAQKISDTFSDKSLLRLCLDKELSDTTAPEGYSKRSIKVARTINHTLKTMLNKQDLVAVKEALEQLLSKNEKLSNQVLK